MSDKPTQAPPFMGLQFLERLRFPQLFLILAAVFLVDLAVPDLVPLVDEIVLGLLTMMLGVWRRRAIDGSDAVQPVAKEPEKNVTPQQ